MQKPSTAWLLWAVLAGGACDGSSTTEYPPIDPFVGRWSCAETRTLTFTTPTGSPEATTQSRFVLNADVADGQVTTYATNEAGAACRLNFTENGTSALLMSGQSCTTLDGIKLDYKMGTADIGAMGLETSLMFEFAGMLQDLDGGSLPDAAGTGTTTSICTRIYAPSSGGSPGGGGW